MSSSATRSGAPRASSRASPPRSRGPGGALVASAARPRPWRGYAYSARGQLETEWRAESVDATSYGQLQNHAGHGAAIASVGTASGGTEWSWRRKAAVGSLLAIECAQTTSDRRWEHTNAAGAPAVRGVSPKL